MSRMTIERRAWPLAELRVQDEEGKRRIVGHAAVFDQRSEPLWEWGSERLIEEVAAGAFTKTLQEADVRALWNHDANYVLGRNKSKTLSLAEDSRGLAFEIEPPDTQWARDLMVSIERGDVSQGSFSFRATKVQWIEEQDEATGWITYLRRLLEVRLYDVSPVTFPAYTATDVQVRALILAAGENVPAGLRRLAEPGQEPHSAGDSRHSNEPGQAPHSGPSVDILTRELEIRRWRMR